MHIYCALVNCPLCAFHNRQRSAHYFVQVHVCWDMHLSILHPHLFLQHNERIDRFGTHLTETILARASRLSLVHEQIHLVQRQRE